MPDDHMPADLLDISTAPLPDEAVDEEGVSDGSEAALAKDATGIGAARAIPNNGISTAGKAQAALRVKVLPGVRVGPVGKLLVRILEHYPKRGEIYVSSAYRDEPGSHHGGLTYRGSPTAALDIAAGSAAKMRDVAKWLYDRFAGDTVQLIHTTPFANDRGFYVYHQRRNPGGSIYGSKTRAEHRDHVHFATSKALAQKVLAKLGK